MTDQIMLRDLGAALRFLTLVALVRKMRLNDYEKYAISNALRDLADEVEHDNRAFVP